MMSPSNSKKDINKIVNKSYLLTISLCFIVCLFISSHISYAHPGRTNAQGCHTDKKTGDYHCHRSNKERPPVSRSTPSPDSNTDDCEVYDRDDWGDYPRAFELDESKNGRGFYTNKMMGESQCVGTLHADHIVSLREAYFLGGCRWSPLEKNNFARDPDNLVPACSTINSSKGYGLPSDFKRRSSDGIGQDYDLPMNKWCEYLKRYAAVKIKYNLSFKDNDAALFQDCGITIKK